MQGYCAFAAFVLLIVLVLGRNIQLRRLGIQAMHFGELDKRDFLIPPFVVFFIYILIAHVWDLPHFDALFFESSVVAWAGVAFCFLAVALFMWALVSFGTSFRVGLDEDAPGTLVTSGAFSVSRNPIYLAFFCILLGIFLVYPTVVFLLYLFAAVLLLNRQISLEEKSLEKLYGDEYRRYCAKVRRYL